MLRQIGSKDIALAITSSILLIFSFPNFLNNGVFILAWFGLIPLFRALENKNFKGRFILVCFCGVIFFTGVIYWLFRVSIPGAIVLILVLSVFFGLFGVFSPFAIRRLPFAIFVPSLWVSLEFLRTHLFTGFPWALLGYSQAGNTMLIQMADITGAYGVSFLVVYVNCVLYETLIKKTKAKINSLAIALFIFSCVLFYGKYCRDRPIIQDNLKIAVIQGNIPQEMKWDENYESRILNVYENLTRQAAGQGAQIVIWPETSAPGIFEMGSALTARITGLAKTIARPILAGVVTENDSKFYNAACLIQKSGKLENIYRKIHLVPFGEYVPFEKHFVFFRDYIDKPIGDFAPGKEFTVFRFPVAKNVVSESPETGTIEKITTFYDFSALICFEDIFPGMARRFVKEGAGFLAAITNDAWFGKTASPFQHNQACVFRAVENRVPVARAANTGVSSIIDQKGNILTTVNINGQETFVAGYAIADIKPYPWRSIYTKFGDIFAWFCVIITLAGIFIMPRMRLVY